MTAYLGSNTDVATLGLWTQVEHVMAGILTGGGAIGTDGTITTLGATAALRSAGFNASDLNSALFILSVLGYVSPNPTSVIPSLIAAGGVLSSGQFSRAAIASKVTTIWPNQTDQAAVYAALSRCGALTP